MVERDKLLFQDMGLPVSKQWLYDRHKVPAPGPKEDLFTPGAPISVSAPSVEGKAPSLPPASAKGNCSCHLPTFTPSDLPTAVDAASESTASLLARQAQAQIDFADLLATTDLKTHDLVWSGGDCPECNPLNGTTYPGGWSGPPPLHHNCDCEIMVQPKK
jgi:hypothetical protein